MGKMSKMIVDAMGSFVNNLGKAGRDKAASTYYTLPMWSDADLAVMYRTSWLAKKIVRIPALDACRNWRNWQAASADIGAIEAEEQRLGLQQKMLDAKTKARLFGGAAIYISTGDSDPSQPLIAERVKKGGIRFLNVMPRRLLSPGEIIRDPESAWYGQPEYYELSNTVKSGVRIHPSRFVIFQGEQLPDEELDISVGGKGWGDSILISTLEAIKNVDASAANIVSLIFEAKIDIIKVPGLMDYLSDPATEAQLLHRFTFANVAKGNNGTLLLDANEEYESKATSFATLPDLMQSFWIMASGAADIPVTRLLGQSPSGMSATGESDLRNYYDRVKSIQTLELDPPANLLNECIIRSGLGARPQDIYHEWNSLWQLTTKERAEIGKIDADTINVLNSTGLYPPEALAKSGANMLVEHAIMPGIMDDIDASGGLPDYELEAEKDLEAANQNAQLRLAANDAAPKTLYISRELINKVEFTNWAKSQGFEDIIPDLHVTVMYTRTPMDWIAVGEAEEWQGGEELIVNVGGPRLVERFDGGATVLQFASRRLAWRNAEIRDMGASVDFPEYQPHVTIAYNVPADFDLSKVEPYQGELRFGPEIFKEVKA